LRSDSLFGAICWRWLELFPETFDSMLDEFREGAAPPFVLSDAWPGDLMPLPLHVPAPPALKKLKPPLYIVPTQFNAILRGETRTADDVLTDVICASTRVQTAIDRNLGFAAEGQLYETDAQHLSKSYDTVSIYVRSERYLKQVVACIKALTHTGFGKKSSSGLGEFEIANALESCDRLDDVAGANAFVALSHFVPRPSDPSDGLWRTHVTFPKFHANAVANVFKGSILMLTPGSVFRTDGHTPQTWYGSMIPIPRSEMPKALHYGLCFSVPLVWGREPA
jgi:CRISPR-associated protein Csm4